MLDAERRGEMTGMQVARIFQPVEEAERKALARMVYRAYREAHYAHIEPQEEFLRGFLQALEITREDKSLGAAPDRDTLHTAR